MQREIPKSLRSRLYRYQGFTTVPTENWNPVDYFQSNEKAQRMSKLEFPEILKQMELSLLEPPVKEESTIFSLT